MTAIFRNDAPMVNESYFPKDGYGLSAAVEAEGFKYPHLQLRNNINKQTKANTQRSDNIIE